MMIKTISGVELGGGTSGPDFTGMTVDAYATLQVDYHFRCSLTPGTYFLNAGVKGSLNDDYTFLHRIADALCFRVLESEYGGATGVVDFGCRPAVTSVGQVHTRIEGTA